MWFIWWLFSGEQVWWREGFSAPPRRVEVFSWVQLEAVALSGVSSLVSSLRPKSTPTPTGSFSVNGMPMEAVDYERLKQVDLTQHHSHPQPTEAHTSHRRLPQLHRCSVAVTSTSACTEEQPSRSWPWNSAPADALHQLILCSS